MQSSTRIANWDDARAECKKNGGVLAIIANQATQGFLVGNIKIKTYTWIGAEKKSGIWSWTDGTPWTGYAKWQSGQPSSGPSDESVVLNSDYDWYDTSKSSPRYYLCQFYV